MLATVVTVGVYETGRASSRNTLLSTSAGENDPAATRGDDSARAPRAIGDRGRDSGNVEGERPLEAANANLVDQISEYRRRLETLADEKARLEASLAKAEEKLAAAQADSGTRRNEYDPTKDEWADLARKGQVNWRTPCYDKQGWTPSAANLAQLGLSPQDAAVIHDAYERSFQRLWSQIRPVCAQELGIAANAEVLEKIGPDACLHLVYDIEVAANRDAAEEAHTEVAEIRAGLRPEPPPGSKTNPVLTLFLLMTRGNALFESDLAKLLGPDEAHVIAWSDELCHDSKHVGGGKKRAAP